MTRQNKPSVVIGIPVHNEEKNIRNLIISLLNQRNSKFNLISINVYADGCTDATVKIVKNLAAKNQLIKLINDGLHIGKMERLNMMFNSCTSDVLVILDGDLLIKDNDVIEKLVLSIQRDQSATMVTANPVPVCPKNFIGKIIFSQSKMWDFVRLSIPNYDHVHNFYGPATAYKGSYASKIHIPSNVKEQRIYLYLKAKELKGFRYCIDANVYYQQITSISDLVKLSKRSFGKKQPEIDELFGYDVSKQYEIPFKYKLIGLIHSLEWNTMYTVLAIIMTMILNSLKYFHKDSRPKQWPIVKSSKVLYAK